MLAPGRSSLPGASGNRSYPLQIGHSINRGRRLTRSSGVGSAAVAPVAVPVFTASGSLLSTRYAIEWWTILRPLSCVGRISTILAQRGSVRGMSLIARYQTPGGCAAIVYTGDL